MYDREIGLYYLQSRYYDPEIGRFINADAFTSTGQGLVGNNMFAYCGNNPISYIDSSGALLEKNPGGGGGGVSVSDIRIGGGGHIYIPQPSAKTDFPLGIPYIPHIPPSTTSNYDEARAEKFAIKNRSKEETRIATITLKGKKPVFFPENPFEFMPLGLIPKVYDGSDNGGIIKWSYPLIKIEIFRWDENPNQPNGPHYHIYGAGHFYPGDIVPEPFASFYFPHLQ